MMMSTENDEKISFDCEEDATTIMEESVDDVEDDDNMSFLSVDDGMSCSSEDTAMVVEDGDEDMVTVRNPNYWCGDGTSLWESATTEWVGARVGTWERVVDFYGLRMRGIGGDSVGQVNRVYGGNDRYIGLENGLYNGVVVSGSGGSSGGSNGDFVDLTDEGEGGGLVRHF